MWTPLSGSCRLMRKPRSSCSAASQLTPMVRLQRIRTRNSDTKYKTRSSPDDTPKSKAPVSSRGLKLQCIPAGVGEWRRGSEPRLQGCPMGFGPKEIQALGQPGQQPVQRANPHASHPPHAARGYRPNFDCLFALVPVKSDLRDRPGTCSVRSQIHECDGTAASTAVALGCELLVWGTAACIDRA